MSKKEENGTDISPIPPAPLDPLSPEGIKALKVLEITVQQVVIPVDHIRQMINVIHTLAAEVEKLREVPK